MGLVIIVVAILFILLEVFFWKKGVPKEPFWEALFHDRGFIDMGATRFFLLPSMGSIFMASWIWNLDYRIGCFRCKKRYLANRFDSRNKYIKATSVNTDSL